LRIHVNNLPEQKEHSQSLRILARERERISKEIASLKNEIKRLIHILFPELLSFINPFTLSSLKLLLSFPSKDAFLKVSEKKILKILYSQKRGRKSTFPAPEILKAAKNSIGITSSIYEEILKSKIRRLLILQKELKRVEHIFIEKCNSSHSNELEILKSIKGLKDVTSSHFIAEIGNIKRFSSAKKLIAYAGVDPSVYESGEFRGKGRISKRGNRSLRRVLYLMAVSVVRVNEVFREYFLKKRAQGKSYKQAIMAVIHKLLRIIYVLLSRQVLFNPSYHSL